MVMNSILYVGRENIQEKILILFQSLTKGNKIYVEFDDGIRLKGKERIHLIESIKVLTI